MATALSSSALALAASTARNTVATKNLQLQHAVKPASVVDLPALEGAGRVIHEQLVKDAQSVPELGDVLTIRAFSVSHAFRVSEDC
jgi:nuclear pore complex protein Nup155